MDPTTQYAADPLADSLRASAVANDQLLTTLSDHHRSEWLRFWRHSDPVARAAALGPQRTAQTFLNANKIIELVNAAVDPTDPRYITLGVPDGTARYVALGVPDRFAVDPATWSVKNLGPLPAPPDADAIDAGAEGGAA